MSNFFNAIEKSGGAITPKENYKKIYKDNKYKGIKTTSYLITYKKVYPKNITEGELFYTLYVSQNGKSIISQYNTYSGRKGGSSWVDMKFGKCVNTSN